jgi:GntR family transcriptional repressor for pyruvate dehydrogenase complex
MLHMIMMTSQLVDLEHTAAFHKPILAAIEQRNSELAASLMMAHLVDASALLALGRQQERVRTLRDHMVATTPSKLQKTPRQSREIATRQSVRFLRRRPN